MSIGSIVMIMSH